MGTTVGASARYVLADHRHIMPILASRGYEPACALPTGLLNEQPSLAAAGFQPGQSVVITGASSRVSLIGVQIAKALGAKTVIATTQTATKKNLLDQPRADAVVVTSTQHLTQAVLEATEGQGVDVVLYPC